MSRDQEQKTFHGRKMDKAIGSGFIQVSALLGHLGDGGLSWEKGSSHHCTHMLRNLVLFLFFLGVND